MLLNWFKARRAARLVGLICICWLGLVLVTVVYATPSPNIDTDDLAIGTAGSGWGNPIATVDCAGSTEVDKITNAWIQSNTSQIFFRIQTCGKPAISSAGNLAGAIDCNSDGDVDDAGDRLVLYKPSSDEWALYDGGHNRLAVPTNGAIYGERISDPQTSNDNVEWRVDYATLNQEDPGYFPADCMNQVNVAFANGKDDWSILDRVPAVGSPLIGWNVPTVVEMKEIKASNRTSLTPITIGVLGVLMAVGLGVVIIYRRKKA
jgi:hypothetical protein